MIGTNGPLRMSQLQPQVFEEFMLMSAPLVGNTVVTSNNGQLLANFFRGSGTWTKNINTSFVVVFAWNGGCGGGGGAKGNLTGGGAGGAGGDSLTFCASANYFSTSVTVTVGAGGLGGAAQTLLGVGYDGGIGGQTSIGPMSIPIHAAGVGKGGGTTTGTGYYNALGGTSGQNSYVMSGGYHLADGIQMGSNNLGALGGLSNAYNPADAVVGTGTYLMPVLPFGVTTGGGGALTNSLSGGAPGVGTPGGNVFLFGRQLNFSGYAGPKNNVSGITFLSTSSFGTFWAWPYSPQMMVTGGSGGAGAGEYAGPLQNTIGGFGGIGAGGGGGASSATRADYVAVPGGQGGPGLVIIYEFI